METENSISEEEVCEIASFKSMNEITGRVIEVKLWNEKNEFGSPYVSIEEGEYSMVLDTHDLAGLLMSIESIMKEVGIAGLIRK